ncbi:MAG: ATP-binding protein [Treponema sp.]|nr:ATP-binding protein [Treponema sp.]
MITNRISKSALKLNYREIIFVFFAFAAMVVAANFFIGRILRINLLNRTEEIIFTAEANVRAGLSEAETTLFTSYNIIQGMLSRDAPEEEILNYLTDATQWVQQRDQGLLGFHGIYGFINGVFYDGIGFNPGDSYVPQTRPWYQLAIRSGRSVAYTAPYLDWFSGEIIVSAVQNVFSGNEMVGILIVDININWLLDYISSLSPTRDGYGMLLSQNLILMAHHDSFFMGLQLQDLGPSYEQIARTLRSGGSYSAHRMIDTDGGSGIAFFSPISNGWFIGLIIPYYQFYRDLYVAAAILIVLGLALSLALCLILLRFSAEKMRSDEESKSKSSFLANMSHEIRTPMNAITGMAELILRGDLPEETRGYAQDIKQAGNNLISIINDILDFSKVEAGKLEILSAKYHMSSLINDTVNIIRTRLGEKPIRFITNIDGNIPNSLIGDEVRIRQILLNLLSNAVKFTEKGHINLTIAEKERNDKTIWLDISVSDTGRGIKQEDQTFLFGDFSQVDTMKNRHIEGTGLGLSITKSLCLAMGGNIGVESEYGKGSTFSVLLPQEIEFHKPYAEVEEPKAKKVLVYEGRVIYGNSVCWSLEKMKVPYTMVSTIEDFTQALNREEWSYVISGYGLYDKIKPVMDRTHPNLDKRPSIILALMMDWGTEAYIPNVQFLPLPVQSLSIANVLNGRSGDSNGLDHRGKSLGIGRFTLKGARLLVVDDIATNLKVAEGLLAPYKTIVDTCLRGEDALLMIKEKNYDIIFMDHMMPEMDGIETTQAIRAWEAKREKTASSSSDEESRSIPIIALTANALVGMREMFIEKGFNDFLAKPIDVTRLDEILSRWIQKEKMVFHTVEIISKEEKTEETGPAASLPHIQGLDTGKGLAMTGGKIEFYQRVLSIYCKDAEKRIPLLAELPSKDDLSTFVTQVHALKSASASIGASDLALKASELEAAGKSKDIDLINRYLPAFSDDLLSLTKSIQSWEKTLILEPEEPGGDEEDIQHLVSDLEEALLSQDILNIDRILDELKSKCLNRSSVEIIDGISDHVLMTEFDEALTLLKKSEFS